MLRTHQATKSLTSKVLLALLLLPFGGVAQTSSEAPSGTEIATLERKVRMPRGASRLDQYVRYYYSDATSGTRTIYAHFIGKFWFSISGGARPKSDVVVVASERDIDIPSDAECSVVHVTWDPASTKKPAASCSSGLIKRR